MTDIGYYNIMQYEALEMQSKHAAHNTFFFAGALPDTEDKCTKYNVTEHE